MFPPSTSRPDSFSSYQRSRSLTINFQHSQLLPRSGSIRKLRIVLQAAPRPAARAFAECSELYLFMCVYINELVTRLHVCDSSLPLSSHLPVLGGTPAQRKPSSKPGGRCCHCGAPTATSSTSNFSTRHAEIVTPFSHTNDEHGSGCSATRQQSSNDMRRAPCLLPAYPSWGGTTISQRAPSCMARSASPRPCGTYSCYSGRPRQGERLTDLHQLTRDESAAATVRAVGTSVEKDAAVH